MSEKICKPKGKYVCDWCYNKFKTENDMGYTSLGKTKLCNPCGTLYVDIVINSKTQDEKIKMSIRDRISLCPGFKNEITKTQRKGENNYGISLTIYKYKE